ncbi:MAG: radical SAM protein [Candidatus Pacearchaeota archaeon]
MDINNHAHLKIALLVRGMNISDQAREGLGKIYQEKIYSYSLTDWIDKKITLPSDIRLDKNIFVGFRLNTNSEWNIIKDGKKRVLEFNKNYICDVDFIPRPKYYDFKTVKGVPLQSIGVSCGNHGLSFFINNYCEYFKNNENCKFCSLVPTQTRFFDTLKKKRLEDVKECLEKILELECPLDFIQLSGGSFYNHDLEAEMYLPYIKIIHNSLEKRSLNKKIPIHLTCMPPNNLSIIDKWRDTGLDTVSFDLECPTKKFFERYCPGKAKSKGYNGMREALRYASKIFEPGNVFSIVIMGIEPAKSFVSGLKELLEEGITPTLNIYHHDPLSAPQMDIGEPNVDELIDMAYQISDLFKKYNAKPGRLGCAHYDIGHEIKKGYFENARQKKNF